MTTEDNPNDLVPGSVYRILMQFAMLGAEIGEIEPAQEISSTLLALRPDLPHAGIVAAMCEFAVGRNDYAIRSLEAILQEFPNSQLCKAMLATCLKNTNRGGWQELLESVIEDGRDEHAVGLACVMLNRKNMGEPTSLLTPNQTDQVITISANAIWA
jgi:predicted Zn-dependent protease